MRPVHFAAILLFSALSLCWAKTGAETNTASAVELAIRHLLEAQHFAGGVVEELLLAQHEGEPAKKQPVYLVEFAIKRSGKLIRCEDWRFTLHRIPEGWAVLKTERGRCND